MLVGTSHSAEIIQRMDDLKWREREGRMPGADRYRGMIKKSIDDNEREKLI